MANRERFHKDFVLDLVSISDYYDSVSAKTGKRFREMLDSWLDMIVDSPEAYAPIRGMVRAVRLRTFPYVILYEILGNCFFYCHCSWCIGSRKLVSANQVTRHDKPLHRSRGPRGL